MNKPPGTHDERQSAYRGKGPDTDPSGHGREDPSAPLPAEGSGESWYPRGHGKGGSLGEGEPEGRPRRDGSTQPDFGQHDALEQAAGRDRDDD